MGGDSSVIRKSAVKWLADSIPGDHKFEFVCRSLDELAMRLATDSRDLAPDWLWTLDGPSGSCKSTFAYMLQNALSLFGETPVVISTDLFIKFSRSYRERTLPLHREWYDFQRLTYTVEMLRRRRGQVMDIAGLYSRATGELSEDEQLLLPDDTGVIVEGMYSTEVPADLAIFFVCDELAARQRSELRDYLTHGMRHEEARARFDLHNMNTFISHCRVFLDRADILVDTTDPYQLMCYRR